MTRINKGFFELGFIKNRLKVKVKRVIPRIIHISTNCLIGQMQYSSRTYSKRVFMYFSRKVRKSLQAG
ncbi:MAG: hypothetical protein UX70_C0001G0198 [Candidatus Wolfebacteria bacterium GW2011_GWB1_47_1]|uniref:Uncharacterized protein n=1 Tax=Candidatus Wolfebacteria bacterium GW2011_GWB1_47_1 TaxID=1619007 RepID=A0A0G4AT44_9BACT|nr:MAG: hypothetical protein UX70_C0001G0198 [Candidatus Wolfebacteria bacterium GW2011_GWB1_47_1]